MADSLIDFGNIAQLSQNNIQNAIQLGWLNQRTEQNDIRQQQADRADRQADLQQQRMRQDATFKAFDELDKMATSPQFATPLQQVDLRYTQAQLLKTGLGLNIPTPSREEMIGAYEQYADNIKQFRHNADPEMRRAAATNLFLAAPQYGKTVLDDLRKAGELDTQGEELATRLETNKAKLQALNVEAGRSTMQQGIFSENLGALAQAMQVTKSPQFQESFKKMQGLSPLAQQAQLTANPQFKAAFQQALQPHIDKLGAYGSDVEQALGEDVKPRYLAALDQQMTQMLQAKNEAVEQHGEVPTALRDQISGLELVRNARSLQYQWMKDPFNKDKFTALQKAQQNLQLANDATGKTLSGIQSERDSIAQTKLTADQQEKLASDYAQEQYKGFLDKGYNENKAAVLAGKQTKLQYPDTPYNAEKLKANKPLAETKIVMNQEKAEASTVGTGFGKQYTALQEGDLESRGKIAKYDRMQTLLSGMQTGKLVPALTTVQSIADSLGLSVDKSLPAKQAFQALSGEIALSLRNPSGGAGMPGALSDKDLTFLQSMTPDLGKTTEGNKLIIDTARKLATRDQEVAKMARDYRKKNGQFDEGFFDQLSAYSDKHPLYEKEAQAQPTTGGKAMPPRGSAPLPSLPQGSRQIGTSGGKPVFQSPDGKRWIGN